MAIETIRTTMSRVMQDQSAPEEVRELALEVLRWRLRDRLSGGEHDAALKDERIRLPPRSERGD